MDGKKLNVAIVGCGAVAEKRHIPSFARLKDKARIYALCDKNYTLSVSLAYNLKLKCAFFTEYEHMLKYISGKIDVVDICTPPQTHADIAVKALNAGCHVLIEKPMALSVSDCDKMIYAAKKNKRKLCIIHNVLFHPPLIRAKQLLDKGDIGDFRGMKIFLADPRNEMIMRKDYWVHRLPGGVIGETGPHPVYISLAFLNKVRDVEVFTKSYLKHNWAKYDEIRFLLDADNGMSSVAVSYSGNRYAAEVDILGSEGSLHVDLQNMSCIKNDTREKLNPFGIAKQTICYAGDMIGWVMFNGIKSALGQFRNGHETVIERFVDAIINDTVLPVTGEQGRDAVEVMEMIVNRLNQKYN